MPGSVYIHIPFCRSKCKYCSFVSFNKSELIMGYMFSLMKEISESYSGEKLKTLYFGGGTPSLVPVDLIEKVIKKFNIDSETEVTIEVNPDDVNYEYMKSLKSIGINRISIGSQTFNDDILQIIGRRHNSGQITEAVNISKQAGFGNISLDLIYGLPTQNQDILNNDIDKCIALEVKHISTYGLKIEEESFWGKNRPGNVPDDDTQADMYEFINKKLEENGFLRYEISNFAKPGYESRHNLNYWDNGEYYGFGVSAHGYINGLRYYNTSVLEEYMQNPTIQEYGRFLTEQEKLEEEIFLGFRKTEGIDIVKINQKYNIDFEKKYKNVIKKFSDCLVVDNNMCRLNLRGVLLSNIILSEFIE